MRSKASFNRSGVLVQRGFSLIELVFVLALIATVIGVALVSSFSKDSEKKMRNATNMIETMFRRARSLAMVQQTVYVVTLKEGQISLNSGKPPEEEEQEDRGSFLRETALDEEQEEAEKTNFQAVSDNDSWEEGLEVEVKRWGAKDWALLEKDVVHELRFDPSGISEPVSIRVRFEGSVIEQEYHPLSASVRNETSEIR